MSDQTKDVEGSDGGPLPEERMNVHLVARNKSIDDVMRAYADKRMTYAELHAWFYARGYSTVSLYAMALDYSNK